MLRRFVAFAAVVDRSRFAILALAFGLTALLILGLRFVDRPNRLKVAVGPPDGPDARLIEAAAERFKAERRPVRLLVRPVASPAAAAKALESGDADLAVARSDVAIPRGSATVAVLHNDVAILAAARGAHVGGVADLAGKRVAVFPATPENAALFDALLTEYEIAPAGVTRLALNLEELKREATEKRIDAIFSVGPLRGSLLQETVALLAEGRRDPVLAPIDAADGMAARGEAYQKIDLPQGFFPGAPPLPKDDFATLGVAVTLEARDGLDDSVISTLTKQLFEARRAIAAQAPLAAAIEKPDGDWGSAASVHPGAHEYYTDNEKSFMDRYGDWIYIGAMTASGLGSGAAAMIGMTRAKARSAALALIDRLIALKSEVHAANSPQRLSELDREIEDLATQGLHFARAHDFDETGLAGLRLAVDEARRAVDDRCDELHDRPSRLTRTAVKGAAESPPDSSSARPGDRA